MECLLGLGHDIVDVAAFAAQLEEPGTRMRSLFSARELRQSDARGTMKADGVAVHLAARWAGKEAVVKAWGEALGGHAAPYGVDDMPWSRIEVLDDSRGCPHVTLDGEVRMALESSLVPVVGQDARFDWHVSLSHDGSLASAVALLAKVG